MNQLTIIGNVSKDPESRTTSGGDLACSFNVAVNRKRNKGTDFFRVTAWNKLGEICKAHVVKGMKVAVEGRVSLDEFTASNGNKYSTLTVMAEEVEFLTRVEPSGEDKPAAEGYQEVADDENLPF